MQSLPLSLEKLFLSVPRGPVFSWLRVLPPWHPWQHPEASGQGCEAPQGPQNHPTASQACGVSTDTGSVGLRVWTLDGPAAWQRQALAAQPWSEFFHFSPRLASLEQTWPQPPLAAGTGKAQILIWMCRPQDLSGVQEMRECANSLCAQPPLLPSPPAQLVQFPSFPCPWTPQVPARAACSLGSSEQLAGSRPGQGRTDANLVVST